MSANKKGRHCNADQVKINHQDYTTPDDAPAIFSPEIDGAIDRAGGWLMIIGAIYFLGQIFRMCW